VQDDLGRLLLVLRIDSGNWELPRGRVELAPLILLSCCLHRVAPGFFGVAEYADADIDLSGAEGTSHFSGSFGP